MKKPWGDLPGILQKALFCLCALIAVLAWPAKETYGAIPGQEEYIINAVKSVKPSVVTIATMSAESGKEGGGSGVILTKDGYIITNSHVVQGAKTIQVTLASGKKFSGFIVRAAKDRDLAVIKISANGIPVPRFGDSSKLQLGQVAIAIGNPLKFSWTVSAGCISALNRDVKAKGVFYRDLIQTDAAINPGSSGGALVNSKGEVIGINTLVYTGTSEFPHAVGLGFAIPINGALETAKYLMKGEVQASPKPWVGISAVTLTKETAEAYDLPVKFGVLVDNIVQYGPAKKAGITPGDVITEINSQRIVSVEDFKAVLNGFSPGQMIELTLWHLGKKKKVTLTVEHLSQ
ncbi:MAG: trypsin-like peptidase domain-containing protein [Candidatus Eremiobacteraeota bacterium]|nr:trypsin-like peptidase domain-containing protein [Candidatus Eremiobacteraeota bacterium]